MKTVAGLCLRLCLLLAVAGCATTTEPIGNVVNAPVAASRGKPFVLSQIAAAIQRASGSLGWRIVAEGPGLFSARLERRAHVAVIEIRHDTKTYSIQYRESTNLDAGNGRIHPAYNRWVEHLDQAIRAELQTL